MDAIATDPDDYHSFMVDDFSALASISDALAIKACDGMYLLLNLSTLDCGPIFSFQHLKILGLLQLWSVYY